MIADASLAIAISDRISSCRSALIERRPIGRGIKFAVRLPSGTLVQVECGTDDDGNVVLTFDSGKYAAGPQLNPATSSKAIDGVRPILEDCASRLKAHHADEYHQKWLIAKTTVVSEECSSGVEFGNGNLVVMEAKPVRHH